MPCILVGVYSSVILRIQGGPFSWLNDICFNDLSHEQSLVQLVSDVFIKQHFVQVSEIQSNVEMIQN